MSRPSLSPRLVVARCQTQMIMPTGAIFDRHVEALLEFLAVCGDPSTSSACRSVRTPRGVRGRRPGVTAMTTPLGRPLALHPRNRPPTSKTRSIAPPSRDGHQRDPEFDRGRDRRLRDAPFCAFDTIRTLVRIPDGSRAAATTGAPLTSRPHMASEHRTTPAPSNPSGSASGKPNAPGRSPTTCRRRPGSYVLEMLPVPLGRAAHGAPEELLGR
jgi:hypothetical protein